MGKSDTLHKQHDEAILDLTQQKQLLKVIATITLLVFVPLGVKKHYHRRVDARHCAARL